MKNIILVTLFLLSGCGSIKKAYLQKETLDKFKIENELIIYVKSDNTYNQEKFGVIENVSYVDIGTRICKIVEVRVDNVLQLKNVKEFVLYMYLTEKNLIEVKVKYV